MIDRYSSPEWKDLWSDENRYRKFLEVELASLKAFSAIGVIPKEDVEAIVKKADFEATRVEEIEKETHHDVIAFTRAVGERLGPEKKWFHYGLTSTDVVDTAYGLLYKEANVLILKDIDAFLEVLKKKAITYKDTPCIGRTHGIHAEITSFGLKFALFYDEVMRDKERFLAARKNIEVGKISGAVGNFANTGPEVQDLACGYLGLGSVRISTQVLQRDRHIEYFNALATIAATLEKVALEIRHLQRTEVGEVNEFFHKGQKGSSAMPHKQNPIGSENICGLSRVVRSYASAALSDDALWHERDISHSSTERIIGPDATTLISYMIRRMTNIIDKLIVHEGRMLENIYATNGVIYSGRLLNTLVARGLSREEAYDTIQPLALKAYNDSEDFKALIKNSEVSKYLDEKEIEANFDPMYYLRYVDAILDRVFKDR